jgi:hypothetical protein
VVPNRRGIDLQNQDETMDGHIRIETYKEKGTNIYVDLFVSKIRRADDAHIASESFPWDDQGAEEATRFLQENAFKIVVMIK